MSKSGRVYCKSCKRPKGEAHVKYKGNQSITPSGYRSILKNGRYQLEHRVNWEEANDACLLPWTSAAIHHVNFIGLSKLDNEADNLLLLSHTEHGKLHRWYDSGRCEMVSELLIRRAREQAYYPEYVDLFIDKYCTS